MIRWREVGPCEFCLMGDDVCLIHRSSDRVSCTSMWVCRSAEGFEFLACARGLGSFAAGEAFDPGSSDEFCIVFKQVDDIWVRADSAKRVERS